MSRFTIRPFVLIWLTILFNACHANTANTVVINPGSSRSEILELMGKPQQMQEFRLPETPFSGPQESLTNLIPAGTRVEEWIYAFGDENLYIWFAGEEGQTKDQWHVVGTARYPGGAVY